MLIRLDKQNIYFIMLLIAKPYSIYVYDDNIIYIINIEYIIYMYIHSSMILCKYVN